MGDVSSEGEGRPPVANVELGGATATAPIADADRVIAGLRPRIRQCYQLGLNADPSMAGKLVITVQVDTTGAVIDVAVRSNVGVSSQVAACLGTFVKRARFAAPPAPTVITIPITFARQEPAAPREPHPLR